MRNHYHSASQEDFNMVNKQRGFTLVEIAIVLVIIGLLLGGVLKGQELITAARVRNLGDQAAGVQAAYYGFIDRYRAVPGDMLPGQACNAIGNTIATWGCPAGGGGGNVGGNGNGTIAAPPPATDARWEEAAAAWSHMAAAGFLQGQYPGNANSLGTYTAPPGAPPGPAAPTNPWNGFLLLATTNEYSNPVGAQPARLHLVMGRNVPVNIMRELDLKMDDSQPNSGILRAAAPGAAAFRLLSGSAPNCVLAGATAIWDINAGASDCNGYFLF